MKSEYLRVFKAFSDERRVRILEILCESGIIMQSMKTDANMQESYCRM